MQKSLTFATWIEIQFHPSPCLPVQALAPVAQTIIQFMVATSSPGPEKQSVNDCRSEVVPVPFWLSKGHTATCVYLQQFFFFFPICLPNSILMNHPLGNEMTKNFTKGWASFILGKESKACGKQTKLTGDAGGILGTCAWVGALGHSSSFCKHQHGAVCGVRGRAGNPQMLNTQKYSSRMLGTREVTCERDLAMRGSSISIIKTP